MEEVLVGIYKIVNPKGKIYIGQSTNILKRFERYSKNNCVGQIILYRSLLKYGFESHEKEILKICKKNDLNKYERFYQEKYNVLSENGMNLKLTKTNDRKCCLSLESRGKISNSLKGRKLTKKHIENIIKGNTGVRKEKKFIEKHKGTKLIGVKGNDGDLSVNSKIILNKETGIYYFGIREAAFSLNKKQTTVWAWIYGQNKNNSNLEYV